MKKAFLMILATFLSSHLDAMIFFKISNGIPNVFKKALASTEELQALETIEQEISYEKFRIDENEKRMKDVFLFMIGSGYRPEHMSFKEFKANETDLNRMIHKKNCAEKIIIQRAITKIANVADDQNLTIN